MELFTNKIRTRRGFQPPSGNRVNMSLVKDVLSWLELKKYKNLVDSLNSLVRLCFPKLLLN